MGLRAELPVNATMVGALNTSPAGERGRSARWAGITNPVAGSWAKARSPVIWICEPASVQGEAPAPYAVAEAGHKTLELGQLLVDPFGPSARERRPVATGGGMVGRELGELRGDLVKGEANALGKYDKGDPA